MEDVEWIGAGYGVPDYEFTLDSTLNCTECSMPAVASYVGGHARWEIEGKPAGRASGCEELWVPELLAGQVLMDHSRSMSGVMHRAHRKAR